MKTPYDEYIKLCLEFADNCNTRLKENKSLSLRMEGFTWAFCVFLNGIVDDLFLRCFLMVISCAGMIFYRHLGMLMQKNNLDHRSDMLECADDAKKLRAEYLGIK